MNSIEPKLMFLITNFLWAPIYVESIRILIELNTAHGSIYECTISEQEISIGCCVWWHEQEKTRLFV